MVTATEDRLADVIAAARRFVAFARAIDSLGNHPWSETTARALAYGIGEKSKAESMLVAAVVRLESWGRANDARGAS